MNAIISCFLLLLLLNLNTEGFSQKSNGTPFQVLFYNVENLFDTTDDPHSSDEEFLPNGLRHWTNKRFNEKINRIAKVIIAAGEWNPPDIIGLCEIENYMVLECIQNHPILNKYNYQIIHQDSPDRRGIDVALLYRTKNFRPVFYEAIPVLDPQNKNFKTRDILMVKGVLNTHDTISVFINHWPSRYGGIMETKNKRALAAKTLKNCITYIKNISPETKIICMGDFNDEPFDNSLVNELKAKEKDNRSIEGELINLSYQWERVPVKTHKHQQNWETFDQFIVSDDLLDENNLHITRAIIFSPEFLLEEDKKFLGVKPNRTYAGYKYHGGFSDHLPIILEMNVLE